MLFIMAWLMIRFGIELSTRLVLRKGEQSFVSFFTTVFGNRINEMDEIKQKIEAYGVVQMIVSEETFFLTNRVALGEGIVTLMKFVLRDINGSLPAGNTEFWDVEVGARSDV